MAKKRGVKNGVQDTGGRSLAALFQEIGQGASTVEFGFISGMSTEEAIFRSYINEYGSDNIPPRPHVTPVADDTALFRRLVIRSGLAGQRRKAARKAADRAAGRVVSGGAAVRAIQNDFAMGMTILARGFAEAIRTQIITLREPPNARATVKKKGFDNPLIDTGHMASEVAWRVMNKQGAVVASGFANGSDPESGV